MRPAMQEIWLSAAKHLSKRSTCKRLKVGAIVTTSDMRKVLGNGYNGNYKGGPNSCDSNEVGNCGCLHAEDNANSEAGDSVKDKIMFCTNLPCKMCAKRMVNSGYSKVYYIEDYRNHDGLEILQKAGIECDQYPVNFARS